MNEFHCLGLNFYLSKVTNIVILVTKLTQNNGSPFNIVLMADQSQHPGGLKSLLCNL